MDSEHQKATAIDLTKQSFNNQLPLGDEDPIEPNSIAPERQQELREKASRWNSAKIGYFPEEGRPGEIFANLTQPENPLDGKSTPEPFGQSRRAYDDRGHHITESLFRSPLDQDRSPKDHLANSPKNISAEASIINQGYKRGLELAAQNQLSLGNSVFQCTEQIFENEEAMQPSSLIHHYVINGEQVVSVQLGNSDEHTQRNWGKDARYQ